MNIERKVHDILLRMPILKKIVKRTYQFFCVVISRSKKVDGKVERITPDDGYEYLFGYYDKSPWDTTNRYMLSLRVKNASKNVAPNEPADIVLIDTKNNNGIKKIAKTRTWNVQQGCMLGWLGPDYKTKIFYNDFRDGKYRGIIMDIKNGSEKIFERPFYSVSDDGEIALSLDFSRLHRLRPGYGYSNLEDKTKNEKVPDGSCVWGINLKTGKIQSILTYKDLIKFEHRDDMDNAEHKVNHLMLSPDGKRFMLIHRWMRGGKKISRLLTCDINGKNLYNLADDNMVSHCCWKNNREILAYCRKDGKNGYFLMKDRTSNFKQKWGFLSADGHPSYSPDGNFVVTDTYPNKKRISTLRILSDTVSIIIGKAYSPFKYDNDTRCDLHPRWSRDGKKVCFDGCFEGKRGVYVIDVNDVTDFKDVKNNFKGKIKVLFVLNTYRDCGPTRVVSNIIKNLDQSKFKPVILTLDEETDNSALMKILPYVSEHIFVKTSKKDIMSGKLDNLKKVIADISPDVIHTTGVFPDYAISKISSNNQVITMHNYASFDYVNKFGKMRGRILVRLQYGAARHAKKTVACSESLSNLYNKLGMHFDYIRNGIDLKEYCITGDKEELRKKIGVKPGSFVFVYTGRFASGKNIDFAVDAFLRIYKSNNKVEFILLGDGPLLGQMRQKYASFKNISFVGRVANVRDYLLASDVYISASKSEGLPNGVLEAMACELPVLLSDIPQHREVLGPDMKGGEIFSLDSIEECVTILKRILDADIAQMSMDALENVKKNFCSIAMSNKYQEIYEDIVNPTNSIMVIKGNDNLFFERLENVFTYYRSYNQFSRAIRKILRKLHFPFFERFSYGGWKKVLKNYNKAIVFDSKSEYSDNIARYIKKKNPNMKIIFWYWNPLKLYNEKLVKSKYIDEIWTYNRFDAKKKAIKYNTQFYHYENSLLDSQGCLGSSADVIFLGRDKGRAATLSDIKAVLQPCGIICDFTIVKSKKDFIDYNSYLGKIFNAKCVVDLVPEPFFGLTLRPLESIFFGKKLITNNKDIINYDFYNKDNVFIIGVDDVDKLPDFLNTPYKKLKKEIVDFYDYKFWLKRIANGEGIKV